ncbi:hypothetical protein [Colwellia sp. 12G3]|uniref:hypothetical protein n=1 Tax=Colwellia sp. 12G3 TaxID=2058299 RepID=UPI000C3267A3|nr:hypothetical protein [Colwellia sp. 12G3]PKI17185.1 hypothetical protein CXF71_05480 [Colwellia sp. 12G3]
MNNDFINNKEESLFFLNFANEIINESIVFIESNDLPLLSIHIEYLRVLCKHFDSQLGKLNSEGKSNNSNQLTLSRNIVKVASSLN